MVREEGVNRFCGNKLPQLSRTTPAIYLLNEEPVIAPLYRWASRILKRNFFGDELQNACAYAVVPPEFHQRIGKAKSLDVLWQANLALGARLLILKHHFPDKYSDICNLFKSVFSTIDSCEIVSTKQLGIAIPITTENDAGAYTFAIREKGVDGLLPLPELSSGMQKVLLIITDVLTLVGGCTYLIDEYENSLRVNAINILPDLLANHGGNNQFVVTSHHPYLINNLPPRDWKIFFRKGSKVVIQDGKQIEEKFGTSKQTAFIQLINDPFFLEGRN